MAIAEAIYERAREETRRDLRRSLRVVRRYEELARRERLRARRLAEELAARSCERADIDRLLGVVEAIDSLPPPFFAGDPDVLAAIENARTPAEHADAVARYEQDFYRDRT